MHPEISGGAFVRIVKAPRTARWLRRFPYVFMRLSPSEMIFEAQATSKRKENSPQARLPCDPPSSTALKPRVPHKQVSECWPNSLSPIANSAPPHRIAATAVPIGPFQGGFPRGLGPTYPCPSTVHMETYSASVFCVLNRIIATTTKICTRSHDRTQAYAKRFCSCPTPSYAALAL